eukprot:5217273-Pyramimonas_sp.AAC.1
MPRVLLFEVSNRTDDCWTAASPPKSALRRAPAPCRRCSWTLEPLWTLSSPSVDPLHLRDLRLTWPTCGSTALDPL